MFCNLIRRSQITLSFALIRKQANQDKDIKLTLSLLLILSLETIHLVYLDLSFSNSTVNKFMLGDFPSGQVVKNLPPNAGYVVNCKLLTCNQFPG